LDFPKIQTESVLEKEMFLFIAGKSTRQTLEQYCKKKNYAKGQLIARMVLALSSRSR
jgi:hypothetical protein